MAAGKWTIAVYFNGVDPATHLYRNELRYEVEADTHELALTKGREAFRNERTEPINSIHILNDDGSFNHPCINGGRHYLTGAA